jgi:hypothetical protein
MAERVGVEPTHALRRLTDFESAPLDHLGTFPQQDLLYREESEKAMSNYYNKPLLSIS